MADLANNEPREKELGTINNLPCKAATRIFYGSMVGQEAASGYCRTLVAGDLYIGMANAESNNLAGSDGEKSVLLEEVSSLEVPIAGALITTPMGTKVYASDGNTWTLTSTANSEVGTFARYGASVCLVRMKAAQQP